MCSEWITHYHQSRPGLNVLQERIDDFIMAHEAREEQVTVLLCNIPYYLSITTYDEREHIDNIADMMCTQIIG